MKLSAVIVLLRKCRKSNVKLRGRQIFEFRRFIVASAVTIKWSKRLSYKTQVCSTVWECILNTSITITSVKTGGRWKDMECAKCKDDPAATGAAGGRAVTREPVSVHSWSDWWFCFVFSMARSSMLSIILHKHELNKVVSLRWRKSSLGSLAPRKFIHFTETSVSHLQQIEHETVSLVRLQNHQTLVAILMFWKFCVHLGMHAATTPCYLR